MLFKTHLMLGVLAILLLVGSVENKIIFVAMVLIATALPDIDSKHSALGRPIVNRPMQFFVKHRGFIHSLTIGVLISVLIAVFFPVAALGFFVGWSVHILGDSFTKEGVRAFWPLQITSRGFITTGSAFEKGLFFMLVVVNIILFFVFVVLPIVQI